MKNRHSFAGRDMAGSAMCIVRVPPVHEGIGNALRAAYRGAGAALPAELRSLLEKLG